MPKHQQRKTKKPTNKVSLAEKDSHTGLAFALGLSLMLIVFILGKTLVDLWKW